MTNFIIAWDYGNVKKIEVEFFQSFYGICKKMENGEWEAIPPPWFFPSDTPSVGGGSRGWGGRKKNTKSDPLLRFQGSPYDVRPLASPLRGSTRVSEG